MRRTPFNSDSLLAACEDRGPEETIRLRALGKFNAKQLLYINPWIAKKQREAEESERALKGTELEYVRRSALAAEESAQSASEANIIARQALKESRIANWISITAFFLSLVALYISIFQ